jgi:hypothetical protein
MKTQLLELMMEGESSSEDEDKDIYSNNEGEED